MKVENNKFNVNYLILILIIVLLLIINLVLYLKKVAKPIEENTQANLNVTQTLQKENANKTTKIVPQTNTEVIKYLSTLKEGNRIEYYCGNFLKLIDEGNYEKAYNLLYGEFKEKYFPTQEEFEEYVKNFYPKFYGIVYDDIDRYTDLYVLRLKIIDYNATKGDEEIIQRVVIREYDYNNFAVSFQVEKNQ